MCLWGFVASVTRWLNYFKVCGNIQQRKLAQQHDIFAKVRLTFSQILNKPSKICPRLLKLCQSGEISPNLVTLFVAIRINNFAQNRTDSNLKRLASIILFLYKNQKGAMVVAQLVEQSLLIPEVRSSNPFIGNVLYCTFILNFIEKTKIKKKRPGMAPFLT